MPKDIFLITQHITEIAFSLLSVSTAKFKRKDTSRGLPNLFIFCCIFGQCRVLDRASFLVIDLSRVPNYMLSRILLLELSNVFSIMIIRCFRVRFYGVGESGKLNPTDLYINGGRGIPIPNHIVLRWGVPVEFAPN